MDGQLLSSQEWLCSMELVVVEWSLWLNLIALLFPPSNTFLQFLLLTVLFPYVHLKRVNSSCTTKSLNLLMCFTLRLRFMTEERLLTPLLELDFSLVKQQSIYFLSCLWWVLVFMFKVQCMLKINFQYYHREFFNNNFFLSLL